MAVEFCEDQAANGVAYTEARFSPHLMASEDGEVGAEQMLKAALEGFREGEERFGTKVGGQNPFSILGDKMNLKVRLGKMFYESSIGVPALLPCSQLPRQARGTVRKLFT